MQKYRIARKDVDNPVAELIINVGQLNCDVNALLKTVNAWLHDMFVDSSLTIDDLKSTNHFYDYSHMRRVAIDRKGHDVIITVSEHIIDYYVETL